jgi:hypothetical protein
MKGLFTWMMMRRRMGIWALLLPVAWKYRHEIQDQFRNVVGGAKRGQRHSKTA